MDLPWHKSKGRLPVILQAERAECALACLSMVLAYHGHRNDITSLRNKYNISQHGVTLKSVIRVADKLNLAGRALRLEIKDLPKLKLPAILHWDLNHFVVLKEVRGNHAIIHNPAIGRQKMDLREFSRHFTGVALELLPTQQFQEKDESRKLSFRELWGESHGFLTSLSQLLLLSLLLQLFALALPFYTQLFIDDVLVNQDFELLHILAIGFFLLTVIRTFTELLRSFVVMHLSNTMSFQFATNVCRHLFQLPLDYFLKRHIGDIVSRFGSLNNIREFLCSGIVEVVIDGLMVIGTLILMFIYSKLLTGVALVAVVLYAVIRFSLYSAFHVRNEELLNNSAIENTNFMENINVIQGIKLFGKESDRLAGWQNLYADVINSGVKVQKLGIGVKFAYDLLVGVENILLVLLGGYAVLNNQISIGMIMAFLSFKDQFYGRVFSLLDMLFELKLLDVHLTRLADIAYTKPEAHRFGIGAPPPDAPVEGGLEVSNLSFRYSEDSELLFENVSFQVGSTEAVAIIGPTGCGKSTLLRIVMSLLQPVGGVVSLHGAPIKAMGLNVYRERVAGVMQNDAPLTGSILENITFFDPAPDQERVEQAAALAAIADDIRAMPMQYNTLVGSMGSALSGGQIQRILLARALYRQPQLLVLDEASSHLDLETEKKVNAALKKMKIARLLVAHRPQTVLLADRILKLTPSGLASVKHAQIGHEGQRAAHGQRRR